MSKLVPPRQDIAIEAMPRPMPTGPEELAPYLEQLFERAERRGQDVIRWYARDRRSKRRVSRAMRAVTIGLASLGIVLPLAPVTHWQTALFKWGYLLLALAAAIMAFDRLFGTSTAWMRDIVAQFKAQALVEELQFGWAKLAAAPASPETVQERLAVLQKFHIDCSALVQDETAAWLVEFQHNLSALDNLTRQGQNGGRELPTEKEPGR